MVTPKCRYCEEVATHHRSRMPVCVKHWRFLCMRESAARRKKAVPPLGAMEEMFTACGMTCPICSRQMNWLRADGAQTVLTLQHNHDGTMTFLCMSCNCRHEAYANDSLYEVGPNQKQCSRCLVVKPLDAFCTDNSGRWADKKTTCKVCAAKMHRNWVEKNREKYNTYMRIYRAKR